MAKTWNWQTPHPTDQHVDRQIAMIRVHSNVSQAELSRSIGISFQQLQKYENARNRMSASMLYEIGRSLSVPVSRFFEGLPGNQRSRRRSAAAHAGDRRACHKIAQIVRALLMKQESRRARPRQRHKPDETEELVLSTVPTSSPCAPA
ncbi:helix-turn-helix domain-containing protein [Ensifer sp. LCM 4579]|uniref:helix-turn-helix domain-containing protein n=1 Tax=Ensifer sp. LCM 4579 TaxID=1848292 RepID=UPI0008DAC243|nr:helix-turn-helix transcriptional regulator [Ensifer sp. LCM 4579]OHV76729.1 hypothetical protein LCM4579_27735 [Ensifer sp. LCM 4579]